MVERNRGLIYLIEEFCRTTTEYGAYEETSGSNKLKAEHINELRDKNIIICHIWRESAREKK